MSQSSFPCTVTAIEQLNSETISISLKAHEGAPFTDVAPGAHVDVHAFMGALIRQYSIWDWSADGSTISIAIKKEAEGRGGSRFMHTLEVGEEIDIGGPHNHFPLNESQATKILVGGGIGITPILAMARQLNEKGQPFKLYYITRSEEAAAFKNVLKNMASETSVHFHHDDRDGIFNVGGLIAQLTNDEEIYVCGPEPLLNAVLESTKDWDEGRVHYERFGALPMDANKNSAFEVVINSSGKVLNVGADETVLKVLDDAGFFIPYACESGICGSCMVDVLEGEIEHYDDIISQEDREKNNVMCVCVSRAKGDRLVLDL